MGCCFFSQHLYVLKADFSPASYRSSIEFSLYIWSLERKKSHSFWFLSAILTGFGFSLFHNMSARDLES